jgi:leucyl aminopeptidase
MAFLRNLLVAFVAAAVAANGAAIAKDAVFEANVAKGLRLIDLDPNVTPVWMTEDEKLELIRADKNFVGHPS